MPPVNSTFRRSIAFAAIAILAISLAACGKKKADNSAFCRDAGSILSLREKLVNGPVATLPQDFDAAVARLNKVRGESPDEIKADVDTLYHILSTQKSKVDSANLQLPGGRTAIFASVFSEQAPQLLH